MMPSFAIAVGQPFRCPETGWSVGLVTPKRLPGRISTHIIQALRSRRLEYAMPVFGLVDLPDDPAAEDEAIADLSRGERIALAVRVVLDRGLAHLAEGENDLAAEILTTGGVPRVEAVEEEAGFDVTASERDQALRSIRRK